MGNELQFEADLYHGAAGYYDSYRLLYPDAMIEYVTDQAAVSGQGRLLDLACGTGQLTFPLRRWFPEVWAVDREPDMVEAVRAKAAAIGAKNIRPIAADAETLDAAPRYFELAVIGNAFHRLRRDLVAGRLLGWLRPGGCVALCWSDAPQAGDQEWQRAFEDLLGRWRRRLGAEHRIPANWEELQRRRPDHQVLSEAGFEMAGRCEFTVEHRWSLPELAGWIRSTSFLPAPVLADQGAEFDADLAGALGPFADDGAVHQAVGFACELARRAAGLACSVNISAMVDAYDVDRPGGLVDPVHHPVCAAPRGVVPG